MNITIRPYNNSPISNSNRSNKNFSNVSFGEDVEANRKLTEVAKIVGDEFIIKQQEVCSDMEKEIRARELTDKSPAMTNLIDTFIAQKSALIARAEELCPGLNIGEAEMEHYGQEADKMEQKAEELLDKGSKTKSRTKSRSKINEKEISDKKDYQNNLQGIYRGVEWRKRLSDSIDMAVYPDLDEYGDGNDFCGCGPDYENSVKEFVPNEFSPKGLDDVAGLSEAKEEFTQKIVLPLTDPSVIELYKEYNIKPYPSYLLYGPPGCGKTMLVEALSAETKLPLFKLNVADFGSPFIHETSIKLQKAFSNLENKVQATGKPCIVFIDELDSLTPPRSSLSGSSEHKLEEIGTFLQHLNNAKNNKIIVIAATNNIENIDAAVKRTGRFDRKLNIGLPDADGRKSYLKSYFVKTLKAPDLLNNDEQIGKIVKETDKFAYSDFEPILEDASFKALKRKDNITLNDVLSSIADYKEKKKKENGDNPYFVHQENPPEGIYR